MKNKSPVLLQFGAVALAFLVSSFTALAATGAQVPWITYEAESMATTGSTTGPDYGHNTVESESSGRKCVKLSATSQYVQFTAQAAANTLVLRYSVPDSGDGVGTDYTISLYKNGTFIGKLNVTSRYSWLYSAYPFSNTPANGTPRNFYDEARTNNISIAQGDVIRIQKDASDSASYYAIDLVDLEQVSQISQPANSLSVLDYGATGNGSAYDTSPIQNCINAAASQGKTVWLPPGNYLIDSQINLPSNVTVQGAGMFFTTLVGDPSLYGFATRRITLNGNGSNIHLYDFAILGKLAYRSDSESNDGLGGAYGTGSSIARIWVEHTKTGAWLVNSLGLVVSDCRFRNTIADGLNLNLGMRSCIVTNCTARGTGDDCFAMWPATYLNANYKAGQNVFTHCTGQTPFLANGGSICGGEANRIEDCLFQDMTYGCGILVTTTFPVGTNTFSGTTVGQRCDIIRCGGYDPGFLWRAAVQVCMESGNVGGVYFNNLNITNSCSDGMSIIGANTLSSASMANVSIPNYGLGVSGRNGLWARSDTLGSMTVSNSAIVQHLDSSSHFTFNFVTSTIGVTVQTSPAGRSFTVDGTGYSSAQTFNWSPGSAHTIATASPQTGTTGTQYIWSNWSDNGALSHSVSPSAGTTYTANFSTQYFLTMNAGTGGSVSPASGWTNSGASVNISATPAGGYNFSSWSGSGSGSYSGSGAATSVTVNGPITQTASFVIVSNQPLVQLMSFVQQPGNVLQGAVIAPEVQVHAIGTNGQALSGAAITLSLGSGSGALGGTLTRTTDASGNAHFNDLTVSAAGPKRLTATASAGSAAPTNSVTFNVVGTVSALAFTTSPGSAAVGVPFGQQPVLKTVDQFGTPTTAGLPAVLMVRVALTNGPGVLTGTTNFNIGTSGGNGVMAFTNLACSVAGTNYGLAAWSTSASVSNTVGGAMLWLDAADANTLTLNGSKVQAWKNKGVGGSTGTNLWFTQPAVALQPWLTNQWNGKPVITFSKNGNGFSSNCTSLINVGQNSYTNSSSQMTYFILTRQSENTNGWQAPVSFSASGQMDGKSSQGVVVLADGSQTAPFPLGIQRNHAATPMQADVPVPAVNSPFLLTYQDDAGIALLTLTLADGTAQSSLANIVNGISPYKYGITDVAIGARLEPSPSTIDNGWDGDIAEVLIYNSALSGADVTAVQNYLTNKWFSTDGGFSLGGTVSAPFTVQASTISVTVQPAVAGRSFSVDGTNFNSVQGFNWVPGSVHTIAATSPQSGGTGTQYVWAGWSDSGAISHTVNPGTAATYTVSFSTQYYVTMAAGVGGAVSPASGWTNSGDSVAISAVASNGFSFEGWTGIGTGSYSGASNAISIVVNGPVTETAAFALIPTRIISLAGALDFGVVTVSNTNDRTLTISNSGNATLTVTGISYPAGFGGNWSGTISAGGSTNVTVTFAPVISTNYNGNVSVNSDATAGSNSLAVSGSGGDDAPPSQNVLGVAVNGDGSVTLSYAATPGFAYHIEMATNLAPIIWVSVPGSDTNATTSVITFTDANPSGPDQFYRVVSP